jgi:hypothetical protein
VSSFNRYSICVLVNDGLRAPVVFYTSDKNTFLYSLRNIDAYYLILPFYTNAGECTLTTVICTILMTFK